ncbi:hypothetical protein [Actinoplanes sp. NPDC026623]|uniref:hypothetical protein n=1 Tax=Actinoplanes sp. NPDC026623 TaxID=3155610 RepID=UPI0033E79792
MRGEPRLDPVRWRRPGRAALLRPVVVAVLLATAAAAMWSGTQNCATPRAAGPARSARPPDRAGMDCPAGSRTDSRPTSPKPAGTDDQKPNGATEPPSRADQVPAGAPMTRNRPAVPAGTVGVPIRLAEPAALRLLRPGDHVDVFRLTGDDRSPPAVAKAALVLDVSGIDDPATGGLLLALTPAEARRTVTGADHGYAVQIRPDG